MAQLKDSKVFGELQVTGNIKEKGENLEIKYVKVGRVLTDVPANAKFTDTTINGKTGVITLADLTALGVAKKDGTNATGTWAISTTGNAATATTASQVGKSLSAGHGLTGTAFNGATAYSWAVAPHAGTADSVGATTVTASGVGVALGTTNKTAAKGNHTHGNITNVGAIGNATGKPIITTTNGVLTVGAFGAGATDFSPGNHTHYYAASTAIAGSATSAEKVNHSVTFKNTGGAASNSSYNGSSALTISYTTVGAAAASHNHNASNITAGLLSVERGGTGLDSLVSGSFLVGNNTTEMQPKTPAEVLNLIGAAPASHGTHVVYETELPIVAGTAALGNSNKLARGNHVHPAQTTISGLAGSASELVNAVTFNGSDTAPNVETTFNGSEPITISYRTVGAAKSAHTHTSTDLPIVPVTKGGTGLVTLTKNNYLIGNGTGAILFKTAAQVLSDIGAAATNHGTHLPALQTASNSVFLRNDNSWQSVTPANIGAPGSTGTGASGTWGISVTGNAGTATTLATARTLTIGNKGKTFNGGANVSWSLAEIGALPLTGGTITGDLNLTDKDIWINTTNNDRFLYFKYTTGPGFSWRLGYLGTGSSNTNYFTLETDDTNGVWEKVFTVGLTTKIMDFVATPTVSGSSILTAANYNTYAPTKTGTGASGSWGISITGNAATASTATKLTTARTLTIGNTGKTFNGTANLSWSFAEIGALPLSGGTIQDGTLKVQGTAANAGYGVVTRSIEGTNSDGSAYGELFLNFYNKADIKCRGTYVNIDSGNYTSYATPANIGAAPASHTHTPAQVGAAEASHTHSYVPINDTLGGVYVSRNVGGIAGSVTGSNAVGVIRLDLGTANQMLNARITIRSYSYLATIIIGGYTYVSTTAWHMPQAYGLINGGDLKVRFCSSGTSRYITIGDTNTNWSGYPFVTIDELNSGYANTYLQNIPVSLVTAYPGTVNSTITIPGGVNITSNNYLNYVYPVGAIYMSLTSTSPATLFGGTWAAIGAGRFLVAAGSGYGVGATGGAATHAHTTPNHSHTTPTMALSIAQLPSHEHAFSTYGAGQGGPAPAWTYNNNGPVNIATSRAGSGHAHGHGNTGNAAPSTNSGSSLPPYYAVYMWRRTA